MNEEYINTLKINEKIENIPEILSSEKVNEYYKSLEEHSENLERYSEDVINMYNELKDKYNNLESKYDKIFKEHEELKYEYSENTIIQSMNDMKNRYEELVKNTISVTKYNSLDDKYNKLAKNSISCITILDRIYKYIRRIDENPFYRDDHDFTKIQLELTIVSEILEDGLPKKIEF